MYPIHALKLDFGLTFASNSSRVKLLGGERATRMLPPLDTQLPSLPSPLPADCGRQNGQSLAAVKLTNQILEKSNPIN